MARIEERSRRRFTLARAMLIVGALGIGFAAGLAPQEEGSTCLVRGIILVAGKAQTSGRVVYLPGGVKRKTNLSVPILKDGSFAIKVPGGACQFEIQIPGRKDERFFFVAHDFGVIEIDLWEIF